MNVPESRTAVGAGYAAVVAALGLVGVFMPRTEPIPRPDFTLEGWRADPALLEPGHAHDDALIATHPLTDDNAETVRALMDALLALGPVEAKTGGRSDDPTYQLATEKVLNAANTYWFANGEDAYRARAAQIADASVEILVATLNQASADHLPVLRWLDAHADHRLAVRLRAYTGNFIENAVSWGLVTRTNALAGDNPELARIHFKLRFFLFVAELKSYKLLLYTEELRALWHWRMEGDLTLPMTQRRQVGEWLQELEPDYPVHRTLGFLLARRGELLPAIVEHRLALLEAPFDRRLQDNLTYLLEAVKRVR